MRLVSHTASNTEIVCALGAAEWLVGVDADSDYPPEIVDRLPQLGRDLDLDTAAVAALKPDLVLTSLTVPGHERVVDELQARGLNTLVIDPLSLDDVYASIRTIAAALDRPQRGDALVDTLQSRMPAISPRTARPRIAVEWWPQPVIVPGRQSWVSDLIELAGGCNPWAHHDARSVTLDPRDDTHQADAIVMSWCGVPLKKYRSDVVFRRAHQAAWPALQRREVHPVSEAFLGRPGPRLVHGYSALKHIVQRLAGRCG